MAKPFSSVNILSYLTLLRNCKTLSDISAGSRRMEYGRLLRLEVMPQQTKSSDLALCRELEMTRTGRLFVFERSVKGKGTSSTSPLSNVIPDCVLIVVPQLLGRALGEL